MDLSFKEVVTTKNCPSTKDIDSFVFEPEQGEQELGSLMVLTEIDGESEDKEASSWLSNLVAYKAKNSFFNIGVNDTEEGIQKACQSLNEKLERLKKEGELSWVDSFNILIVALSPEGALFISRTGKGGAFIAQEEKMANIDSQLPSSGKSYLFEQLGEAKLSTENSLLLFSSSIDSLSEAKQRKYLRILLNFSPEKAKEKLDDEKLECFAALICSLNTKKNKVSLNWKTPFQKIFKESKRFLKAIKDSVQNLIPVFGCPKEKLAGFFGKIKKARPKSGCAVKNKLKSFSLPTNKNLKRFALGSLVVLLIAGLSFWVRGNFGEKKETLEPAEKTPELPSGVELAFDLASTSTPDFSVRSLLIAKDNLWAVGADKLQSLSSSQKVSFEEGIEYNFSSGIHGYKKDKFYLFSEPDLLTTYNLNTATSSTKNIYIPTSMERVHSLGYFRDHLYLLAPEEKQIVKYPDMDFDSPRYWLSDEASKALESPSSFSIDGSIYLLDSKLGLGEYRVGKRIDEFSLSTSSLSSNDKLYLREDFSKLYLYQPEGNLKIYDKEKKELSDELEVPAQADDFVINKDETNAYLLGKESKIYRIEL